MNKHKMSAHPCSVVEGYTFFVFDHTVLKKEEDDLIDAIIYYYPSVDADKQCALVGQLIGMSEFFKNTFPRSYPTLFKLHQDKFVLRRKGDFTFSLGGSKLYPDSCLQSHIDFLLETFVFYQGSLIALKESLQSEFLSGLSRLWNIYLPFCENFGDLVGQMFQMLPTVDLPKSCSQLFLHSSHILQRSVLCPNVLAGAILYRNQSLCTQLPPSITKRLLLLKPKQSHLTRSKIATNFDLPQGVQLLKVYLSIQEYEVLCPRRQKSSSSQRQKQNHIRNLNQLGSESLDISEISFLECHSANNLISKESKNNIIIGESHTSHSSSSVLENKFEACRDISDTEHKSETESDINKGSDSFFSASDHEDTGEVVHQGDIAPPLPEAPTAEGSPVKKDITFDTTSSEDLSMGESSVDSRVIKKHAQHLRKINQQLIDEADCDKSNKNQNIVEIESCDKSQLCSENMDNKSTETKDTENNRNNSKSMAEDIKTNISDISELVVMGNSDKSESVKNEFKSEIMGDAKEQKLTSNSNNAIEEDAKTTNSDIVTSGADVESQEFKFMDKIPDINDSLNKNTHTNISDASKSADNHQSIIAKRESTSENMETGNKAGKFDRDSEFGQSSGYHHLQPTIVDSDVVLFNRDVITDEDENKLIKSSGSSITSDEMYLHSTDNQGFLSTNESHASLESLSSTPSSSRKKSVTFSNTKTESSDGLVQQHLSTSKNNENVGKGGWQPLSDDLIDIVLYVQGHSDMMLILCLDINTECEKKFITGLWKSSVSHLADLDYEVKECLLKAKRDKEATKTGENYHYLKYDSMMQTMSGNTMDPITSVGYDFVNTASKIHDSFSSSKTTTEVLFRSHTGSCYGCQSVHNEAYFQINSSSNRDHGGCPSPKEAVFSLDQTAADKLQTKHNQTLL